MTYRKAHGRGKQAIVRIETLPADELPFPVAGTLAEPIGPVQRTATGRVADTVAAQELGKRGGLAKAQKTRLATALGLKKLPKGSAFKPYLRHAEIFVSHHLTELAKLAGGHLGAAPSSMVASAGLQLAASRYLFDQGASLGDPATLKQASQLANDSRQNLMAAYELAIREAEVRPQETDIERLHREMGLSK